MTTITLPLTPRPNGMAWKLIQPSQVNTSEWTGARQVLPSNRGWWECQYSMPVISGTTNVLAWRSFFAQARGAANDFQVPVDVVAQSKLPNTVLVRGAGQTGRSIITDGWPASSTVMKAGQFITIENQLVQLTANATSDGSGIATLTFEPAIRAAPADNAPVEYRNPYCLMYMTEEPQVSVEPAHIYTLGSLNLRESF